MTQKMSMNSFLKKLIPSADTIGILRTEERVCVVHGPYEFRVYGYVENGHEVVAGEIGCYQCRCDADRKEIAQSIAIEDSRVAANEIGIPLAFHQSSFDTYKVFNREMSEALEVCKRFSSEEIPNAGLLLCGPTERGKSHLIYAILKSAYDRGKSAMFSNEIEIYREVKESYLGRKDCMTERQVIEKYTTVDYLAIDEIGRAAWTEYEARILSEIIMKRSDNKKRTVLSTNMTPDKILGYFDSATRRKLDAVEVVATWSRYSEMEAAV